MIFLKYIFNIYDNFFSVCLSKICIKADRSKKVPLDILALLSYQSAHFQSCYFKKTRGAHHHLFWGSSIMRGRTLQNNLQIRKTSALNAQEQLFIFWKIDSSQNLLTRLKHL